MMLTSRRNRDSVSTEKSESKGKDGQERSVYSVQMRTKLSGPSLTTSRNVVHLQTAVPTRSVDTNHRDRRHKPHRSPWLSSDADSEDSSGDEGNPSRGRQRHKKPHSHRKKSSTSSAPHLSAVRSKKEKRRPSPPHVVLKLRRVASSPHPTTKGTASTGRHNKEYVVVRGNKSTGHGDTGSLEQRSSNPGESCREVRKVDGRRRISYEQYKANLKRSAVHKSKVGAEATSVPSATAHTSKVSDETEKMNNSDRRSQSEEQRLAEVTARIRARNRAICPLTAEYSLKKMSIHPRRPTSSQLETTQSSETRQGLNARRTIHSSSYPAVTKATGPTQSKPPSVGEDAKARAVRHGHDVITYQPTSPRSRTGMTLADFVKMAKEKGGKDQILKTLAAQRAAEKSANIGRNGTRCTEPPGPHTTTTCTAGLGQKMPVSSTRPDGRHQHKLSQPEMPPSGQKNTAPPVVPPLSTDRADRVRFGHDARAELVRPSRDPVWSRRDEGLRHQSQQRVRAKNKVAHKSSTGGEAAKRPNSVMPCNTETDARRHGNGIGIKRAENVTQLTSQRKPLTSPPKPLMSPPKPMTSPPTSLQKVDALNNKSDSQPQVETCADSPADEPAKRQHSVWSSDSESEESDDECWCMECFKSRIMGWSVPHVDKFAAKKQASEDQTDTAVTASVSAGVRATAEDEDSAETAVTTSTSSETPVPEKSHAVAMATTASSVTEKYVSPTTETTSTETRRHDSTGIALPAPLVTPTAAVLSESAAPATVTQPLAPSTPGDQITLEEALATLLTTESEGSPKSKTTKQESTKRDTLSQECSEMNMKTTVSPSSPSQEEWFKVFLDEAFGDFRPVSPTGSLHSSLFGSSKSSSENQADISQDTTGQKKVRSSSESTQGSGSSSSSFRSSNDTGRARAKRTASKKRARSRSDTSSGKSERGSTSCTTTPSNSLSINDLSQHGDKITSPKKRARSSSDTSSSKSGRGSASTTTTSSPMSSNGKLRRGGKGTGPKKLARGSSDTSSSKDGRGSTGASSSSSSQSICRKSRRGGKRAGPKKLALIISGTSSDNSGRGSTNTSTLPSVDKYSRRGGKRSCPKKRARSSSDTSRDKSSRGSPSTTTSLSHLPSSDNQAYCGGTKKRARTALDGSAECAKPPGQNKLMSMYYSCEPIDFFAPDEKRDDGDDGYETPWNFGVTPNLSLSRSDDGLWHSCKPVRSLSRPPPLPPPLYHPRPPGLEHIEDSPPPTSPGSPRHPEYPLRFGATGRSKPAHYYMAPYHRVGVLEHIGSPLQSTSTCPDHMVARYQNYLWIEPYDWGGTGMCDMFDATE
ncbi:Hypp9087 [Branchiostoma lanceolatum]|uniref:Hypp9087 protein n=1 Tax=Branchiostoma lanceolatum TaxID=7740 RepID=A0A8J9ZE97_BRALA|nr:Hypp9087 [Branchiostoma lanceolatum]